MAASVSEEAIVRTYCVKCIKNFTKSVNSIIVHDPENAIDHCNKNLRGFSILFL